MDQNGKTNQSKRLAILGILLVMLLSIISVSIVVASRRAVTNTDTLASDGISIANTILNVTKVAWDTYSHPDGFSLDAPRGWTASELIEGQSTILIWESPDRSATLTLLLFPADLALDMETPAMSPTISSVTVDGIQTSRTASTGPDSVVIYVGPIIRNDRGIMFSFIGNTTDAETILDRMTSSFRFIQ